MLTCRIISIPWCDQVVKIGDLKFGLVHGHTVIPWGDISSLGMIQRQLDVDILISGHTHEFRTYAYEDKLLVNPGSATGAYSSKEPSTTPSFCLFDVDASKVSEPATRRKTGRDRGQQPCAHPQNKCRDRFMPWPAPLLARVRT